MVTFLYALLIPTEVCVTAYEGGEATGERCATNERVATVTDIGLAVGVVATLGGMGGIYRLSGGVHWAVEFVVAGLLLLFGGWWRTRSRPSSGARSPGPKRESRP